MTPINGWPVRAAVAVAVSIAVAACGATATKSSPSGGKAEQVSVTAPKSGCGSFTAATPADPDHVLAELSSADRAAMAGYLTGLKGQVSILKSNWSDWKPSHKPPYTVGVAWIGPVNDSERLSLQGLLATLKASPLVKNVITEVVSSPNVPEQIQQYNQIVSQKPDIMLLSPVLVGANENSINAAAKRGIPTIAMLGGSTDPNIVAVDGNTYLNTALQASYIARTLGGNGTVLYVHGLAGANPDVSGEAGFNAVLAHCPGMKVAQGAVYGQFLPAAAQSQTAQYLATHPATINAVWQAAEMTSGIMQAFERAGRPMPLIADTAPNRASLGYWQAHRSTYHGIAGTVPSVPVGEVVGEVALRMLSGQEVKTNDIVGVNPLISDTNLDQWSSPSWTLDTAGGIAGLPGSFLPASLLNGYFKHPGPVK